MMPLKTSDLIWCPRTGPLRQKYHAFSPPLAELCQVCLRVKTRCKLPVVRCCMSGRTVRCPTGGDDSAGGLITPQEVRLELRRDARRLRKGG